MFEKMKQYQNISKCKAFQGRIGRPKAVQYLEQTKLHMRLFYVIFALFKFFAKCLLTYLTCLGSCAVSASDMLSIHLPGRVDAV